MQNNNRLIEYLSGQNQQLKEQIQWLEKRLDIALNTLALQNEEIQKLKDEIASLKGQKPRLKIPPSSLEGAKSKDKQKDKSRSSRGKHPRRKKTMQLEIHLKKRIKPESVPSGAVFKGCQKFTVQDIVLRPYNTVFELERWKLPDGSYMSGKLPENISGHYGPQLVSYILHQYYGCRITGPLLLTQLKEVGILISEGQLNNILIQAKEAFHQEKNDLLSAGIAATGQVKTDDTGARHKGQNGYSTILGNEYFTYIVSTKSKSRINFLKILHGASPQYLINEDTLSYIESMKPLHYLGGYLLLHAKDRSMSRAQWEELLQQTNVCSKSDIKLATEAALFASLIASGIPRNLGVHGDDAGQFDVFVRSLCWIHEERHYRKIIPIGDAMREEVEQIRDKIWELYRGLQEYKLTPSQSLKTQLKTDFDNLFLHQKTTSPTLNRQLAKTYAKKEELLRVLERPDTPLHNNGTETDAREMVIKRKISGGTRSEEGRQYRDTFISLKKTCVKLDISFWAYLKDRVWKLCEIAPLSRIILDRSKERFRPPQTCP